MNRKEFINLIIDRRSLNKEVYDLSLKIDDFPIARQVLNKIWGNINIDLILTSNKFIDINNARGDLISNTINFINDPLLKSETKKFINDLVDQKILGSNYEKKEKTNYKNKKNKEIKNTSQNQLIPDPWDSTLKEKTDKQTVNNENSKTIPNSENDLLNKKNLYKNKKVSNLFTTIFELGAKHFHKGDYEDSIECYSLLLNQGLNNIEVKESIIIASRGCCFFELGRFNDAILDFSKAINLDNKTPSFFRYRGQCNFELEKYDEAISDFTKSLSLNKDPQDFFKRGESKLKLKYFKKAILDFNKAIDLENKTPSFFRYRGQCNFELEKYDEAISDFTKALYLEKNEKSYFDFYMRGKCKYKQQKTSYALVDLKKSIELLPKLEYNEEFFNEPIDLYNQIIKEKNKSKEKIQENSQKDISSNKKSIGIGLKNKSSEKYLSNNIEYKKLGIIALLSTLVIGISYPIYLNKKYLIQCLLRNNFNTICFQYYLNTNKSSPIMPSGYKKKCQYFKNTSHKRSKFGTSKFLWDYHFSPKYSKNDFIPKETFEHVNIKTNTYTLVYEFSDNYCRLYHFKLKKRYRLHKILSNDNVKTHYWDTDKFGNLEHFVDGKKVF